MFKKMFLLGSGLLMTAGAEEAFKANNKERQVTRVVSQMMGAMHYSKARLDDEMSERIFDAFFRRLDYNKRVFLESDILEFKKYKSLLDNMYLEGDLTFAERVFDRFKKRLKERLDFVERRVEEEFDLDDKETLVIDREDSSWQQTSAQLDDLWRKFIENEILNQNISDFAEELRLADELKKADEKKSKEQEEQADEDNGTMHDQIRRRMIFRLKNLLEIDRDQQFEMAISIMTGCFDPHSSYFGPRTMEEFDIMMKLSLSGIGATLSNRDGYIKVEKVMKGGPAERGKELKAGDRIIEVGQGDEPTINVVDMPLSKAISMIRGPKGKVVTLHVLRGGINGRLHVMKIKRDKIQISDAAARGKLFELEREGKKEKVGVVYLPSFYYYFDRTGKEPTKSCADDIKKIILDLKEQGMESLVVDLRDNGGGSLSEVVKMTGFFIDEGPVVQVRDHRGKIDIDEDEDGGVVFDGPLTVMVNQHSASASEIFAAAIQDYERGVIVGTADRTHGKGTVQHVYPLNRIRGMAALEKSGFNPGELKFTVAKFYRVNGGSTQMRGVIPDIALPHYYDKEEQGESSLRYHLTYDTIPSADIDKDDSVLEHLKPLQLNSFARIQKNKDFDKFLEVLSYYRDRYSRKEVSLKEGERKDDFVAHRDYQKKIKPLMRRLAGKPEVTEEEDSEEDAGLSVFSQDDKDEILLDIYLQEAVQVTLDLKKLVD